MTHRLPVALALAALLVGAGPAQADLWTQPGHGAPSPGERSPRPAPGPAGSGASQPSPARLRLGATGPLSGPWAARGTILAVARALLAARGVADLVIEDDGATPVRSVPAARHLEDAWRVAAFVSPLEHTPVSALMPYLRVTRTPTLFMSGTVSGWTGPRILGLPPNGAALTRALGEELGRRVEDRRRRGVAVSGRALALAAASEDATDRLAGLGAAGLAGLDVRTVHAGDRGGLALAFRPDVIVLIGTPAEVAAMARRLGPVRAAPCQGPLGEGGGCEPPLLGLSLTEPFDWRELSEAALEGAITLDWLPLPSEAPAAHRQALRTAGFGGEPSRATLWGHALAELVAAVVQAAGPGADGDRLLRAAEGLGAWSGLILQGLRFGPGERWPVRRARAVTLTAHGPQAGGLPWLTITPPRP
jgi:hypothetical protein